MFVPFTPEQIDAMSKEMIAKAEEHFNDDVLKSMTPEAIETMERKTFLKAKLHRYITNAFLEGVAQAMSYVAATLQREVQRIEEDGRDLQ